MSVTGYTQAGADAQFATQAAVALKADASGLAAVATSGSYADLANTPTLGTAAAQDVAAFATAAQGAKADTAVQPAGSITGNAATATKLATARTIAGKSFDGTANISLAAADVGAATAAQGAKADTAAQQAVASGASPVRFIGYGTTLPGTAQAGDVFFLQGS